MTAQLSTPLSDDELEELDRFLLSAAASDETMLLDALDGYLTAIVIGPTTILPSRWLPDLFYNEPLAPSNKAARHHSAEVHKRLRELLA